MIWVLLVIDAALAGGLFAVGQRLHTLSSHPQPEHRPAHHHDYRPRHARSTS